MTPLGRLRPVAIGVMLLATLVLSGGCWDRVELADLNLVSGVAFDAAPNGGIVVTCSIILPQNLPGGGGGGGSGGGGGGTGPAEAVISAGGSTIGEAVTTLAESLPGHLFWGHTRVVLIGEALARRGIQPVLDYFMRSPETRLSTDLILVRGEAGPLLQVSPPYRIPGTDVLYEHLRRHRETRAPVYQVAQTILTTSGAALIPEVRVTPATPGPASEGGATGTASVGGAVASPSFLFTGAGVVRRGKLVAWLNDDEMRGAMWLLGTMRDATVALTTPQGTVTVHLSRIRIHRRAVRLPRQGPEVRVDIMASGVLDEVQSGSPPLGESGYLLRLSNILADTIRASTSAALAAARSEDADFVQFGRLVAADQPALWLSVRADWPQSFRRLPVLVTVRSNIHSVGNLVTLA